MLVDFLVSIPGKDLCAARWQFASPVPAWLLLWREILSLKVCILPVALVAVTFTQRLSSVSSGISAGAVCSQTTASWR